ncbi:MAG: hypothetical protein HY813_00360 [Candidatus Portnoybacteria bacterium]|nr:hypothetical protein [Candidatus Portnoybacteria bacterium]
MLYAKYLFAAFLIFLFSVFSFPVLAGVCGPLVPSGCRSGGPLSCGLCQFFELFSNIINFVVFCVTPPVAGLMIVVSGLILIFGGSESARTYGKKMLTTTVLAIVIIYASWLLINTIIKEVGGTNQGSWYQFQCLTSDSPPLSFLSGVDKFI